MWQVSFAIKSKGGDCWHYEISVVLDGKPHRWQIIVHQISSKELMIRLQRMKKAEYTCRFTIYQVAYRGRIYAGSLCTKSRIYAGSLYTKSRIHAGYTRKFLGIQKCIYTRVCWSEVAYAYARTSMHGKACTCGKTYFEPWRLVLGNWTYGFWTMASRQTCWSLVLSWWYWFVMVLDHGIEQGLRL